MAALNESLYTNPKKINEMLDKIEQKINNLLKLGNKITAKQQILLEDLNKSYIEIKEKQLKTTRSRSRSKSRSPNETRHNGRNRGTKHNGRNGTRHNGRTRLTARYRSLSPDVKVF